MTFKKKLSALLAAGAIGLAGGTFGVAMPTAIAQADLVDVSHQGSLTINKKLGDPTDSGYENMDPLAGVAFNVQRINNVDLTTNEGWATLAGLTPDNIDEASLGAPVTQTTGEDGVTKFSNLAVGAYYVTEGPKTGFSTIAPFIVTLPFSGENGAWNYDQVVYPKNQNVLPDKTVIDSNATIGSNLTYAINAPVPAGDLDRFNVVDELNTSLEPDLNSVSVTAEGATFTSADYAVTYENETPNDATPNAKTLRVNFTSSGLRNLQTARAANPNLKVNVAFEATINSIPADSTISNVATVELPNGASVTTDDDGSQTSTIFGNLTINKKSSVAGNLGGAVFELYRCVQDGDNWTVQGEALNMATGATADAGDVATTISTTDTNAGDTQAVANGYGIPLQTASGEEAPEEKNYCVLETQAPDTYVRNPEPQPVRVDMANHTMTVDVQNEKESLLGQLPATGAWGIGLIFLIGLALLARGLYTSYRDSKATA